MKLRHFPRFYAFGLRGECGFGIVFFPLRSGGLAIIIRNWLSALSIECVEQSIGRHDVAHLYGINITQPCKQ
jgi:hypothetical protein